MVRTKSTNKDCEDLARRTLLVHQGIDEIMGEDEAVKRLQIRQTSEAQNRPDCAYHRKTCKYILVERKRRSLRKALSQIEDLLKHNPHLQGRVEQIMIALEHGDELHPLSKQDKRKLMMGRYRIGGIPVRLIPPQNLRKKRRRK